MSAVLNKPPRWERRKQSRPAELLAAALDLFVEHGFAATRLDDVAKVAGVSKGTLYLYYTSKEDLFRAVVRQNIVPLIDAARDEIEQSSQPCTVLLERFFLEWWQRFGATKLSGILKLVIAEAGNFPEVADFFLREVATPDRLLLASILQRGIKGGEFRQFDVEAATSVWLAPLVTMVILKHSLDACTVPQARVAPHRALAIHVQMILAAITRPGQF